VITFNVDFPLSCDVCQVRKIIKLIYLFRDS